MEDFQIFGQNNDKIIRNRPKLLNIGITLYKMRLSNL